MKEPVRFRILSDGEVFKVEAFIPVRKFWAPWKVEKMWVQQGGQWTNKATAEREIAELHRYYNPQEAWKVVHEEPLVQAIANAKTEQ